MILTSWTERKGKTVLLLSTDAETMPHDIENVENDQPSTSKKSRTVTKTAEAKIVNDTTIIHKVDLRNGDESTLCGVRSYICRLNRSLIAMRSIYVARPPPAIKPADFKCISYNRKRLVCQFQRDNSCGLYTEYNLSMIRLSSQSVCNLTDNGTMLSFDSSSDTCVFSSGHRTLTFRIEGTNKIGKTESTHLVDHFDIVRPEEPSDLDVSFLDITSVNLTWSMSFLLYNLNRSFEVEFHLITKHGVIQTFVNLSLSKDKKIMHHFEDLYAFTSYELRMRVRVIPKSERNFEEDYWSEWSSIEFQTKPCKPYEAPRILSGAYSFKERRENLVTIEVYWEQIPEHRYNGPGFGYGIYALSQSATSISQISFKLTDITEQSFTLRLQLSCMDQSLIDRYDVRYWPTLKRDAMRNQTFRPYDTVIPIENLVIDTEYEVIVTAYDDRGNTFEASSSVRTKDKDILMQLALFLLFGMLVMGFITTTATRKVKKIMNIKVEIPSGLLGIYETPIQVSLCSLTLSKRSLNSNLSPKVWSWKSFLMAKTINSSKSRIIVSHRTGNNRTSHHRSCPSMECQFK
ncbi:AAEL000309-PA [Aedes aegypti]|uniref:AAEL000309-PA n=1 Tax=Aedes aegypti TaxID=7159 RepID=Q17PG8_AEDAE|nr:AAEL000309-PA [Aedes aegypti]